MRRAVHLARGTALALGLLAGMSAALSGCRRPAPAARAGDAGSVMRVPSMLAAVGAGSPSGREMDAPLAWMFLPQAPVLTGSVPDVLTATHLPCGFQPMYGTVDRVGDALRVRVRARFTGPGLPRDRVTPCPTEPPWVQFVSLNRIRLGTYTVEDAAGHPAGTVPAPAALQLEVLPDDPRAPAESTRWVRPCRAGDDGSCVHGGVCGEVQETPGRGVCVPPHDAFLIVRRPCPEPSSELALAHPGPYAIAATPAPGTLRACLPACNARGECPADMQCLRRGSGRGACVPR